MVNVDIVYAVLIILKCILSVYEQYETALMMFILRSKYLFLLRFMQSTCLFTRVDNTL